MKKNCLFFAASILFLLVGCKKSTAKVEPAANGQSALKFLASTSWTAGFMDIAGVDGVEIIAPASLRHPPEYEVTVSDIQKINDSSYFVYAGFERMMKTLGDAATADSKMIKIKCRIILFSVIN